MIIGACNRQGWYRRKGINPTEPGNVNWELAAVQGNYLHEMLSDLMEEHGFSMGLSRIGKEQGLYDPRVSLSGRTDYMAWDHNLGEPIGIEIKSVGDWKSKKCLEFPADEHIMQSMLYLDYYQTHIPKGQAQINRWYIWYMARGENWDLKGKKNSSPFVQLWDFYLTLNPDGSAVVHTPNGPRHMPHLTISGMHERYAELEKADKDNVIPDRDFEMEHTEEVIAGMYKSDMLELKGQKDTVSKWLNKGGKKGELDLTLGDFACRACGWKSLCWGIPTTFELTEFDLPAQEVVKEDKKEDGTLTLL